MSAPKRIQRRRAAGWRMPDGARYVGRPTVFGNPAVIERSVLDRSQWIVWAGDIGPRVASVTSLTAARQAAVDTFRDWVTSGQGLVASGPGPEAEMTSAYTWQHRDLHERLHELAGRDLACWCPLDQPCHADVLLELANQTTTHLDTQETR